MKNKRKLKPKEKEFCRQYVKCLDAEKAALRAQYKNPLAAAYDLLGRSDIVDEIESLSKLNERLIPTLSKAIIQKLSFGDIADALTLVFSESPEKEDIEKMDLFCISEIKRTKDKTVEIKFFDRLKAIERLTQNASAAQNGVGGLYDALILGAKSLEGVDKNDL